jgi:hypothetical protein
MLEWSNNSNCKTPIGCCDNDVSSALIYNGPDNATGNPICRWQCMTEKQLTGKKGVIDECNPGPEGLIPNIGPCNNPV